MSKYQSEGENRAKQYAFKLLGRRDYTITNLKTKLEKKGYSRGVISKVIKYLVKVNLLNDRKFALNYAHSRLKKKPRGSKVLEYELFKKGIPKDLVDEVVSDIYKEVSEEDLIKKVIKKEIGQRKITEEIRSKLYQKLIRLGFSYEIIEKALK